MDSHPFSATTRTITGKQVSSLRTQGLVPAVVYGHKQESLSISLDARTFTKLYKEFGSTTLIDLSVDTHQSHKVLVHSVQLNPRNKAILHVDFYQVNMKEKLHTEIPLEFIGVSEAVDSEGGTLLTVRDAVNVECLPDDLIQELQVDISSLKTFDDVIRVKDLVLPKGITVLDDEDETILSVTPPRSEEEMQELEETPTEDVTAVESDTKSGTDSTPDPETSEK